MMKNTSSDRRPRTANVGRLVVLIVLLLMAVAASLAQAASSAQATSTATPLPCPAYLKNPVAGLVHPMKPACITSYGLRWLTCLNNAYDRDIEITALTCFKLRKAYEYGLIYTTYLPRIKKRNELIDLSSTLDDLCSPENPIYCFERDEVEKAIRKLQR